MGDGVLVEFASAVKAVEAALELQRKMAEANGPLPEDRHIVLRIGINLGDVIGYGTDIYGDGVNVAARLECVADPGSVTVSGSIHDQVKSKLALTFVDCGEQVH
jgi:class 3 adenylate cyclase